MEKVVLGLSGGVDSAVAAAKLKSQGFEVHGLFLELGLGGEEAAEKTAEDIGVPLYVSRKKAEFEKEICAYFVNEYVNARTPNPCARCNPLIKFRALEDYANQIGAAFIATGHYAKTGRDSENRALLMRSESGKDQSYMLYRLERKTVGRCIFPLAEAGDKASVRQEARKMGLEVAEKPDSMDVCFIPDGDVKAWLEKHGAICPEGNFVDAEGNVLGRHKGLHRYTVGQRKGLGVPAGARLFVKELRPDTNEILLSFEDVFEKEIRLKEVHYIAPEYAENGAFRCEVRVRFSVSAYPALVYPDDRETARIVFEEPARAPAKGQSAVFYDKDIVIGGGIII